MSVQFASITAKINNDLKRGATIFNGTGAYTGESKKMVYAVMSRRELEILKQHI
ncbi:MAG TPA: hypothetical protein DCL86_05925 [Bacteroidales bacterium]|nr:hypothetical protein [Bacteroidales bacterium]